MMKRKTQYSESDCAVFYRTREQFGGLSNMAAGFPIRVDAPDTNPIATALSSEHLYQALKLPDSPDAQAAVLAASNGFMAKQAAYKHKAAFRSDWQSVSIPIMKWCLGMKLLRNPQFGALLRSTGELPIVEKSKRDGFWGAVPQADGTLVGENQLGRLLDELRREYAAVPQSAAMRIAPVQDEKFMLLGMRIGAQDNSA